MKAARIPRNRVRECRTHGSVGGLGEQFLGPTRKMVKRYVEAHADKTAEAESVQAELFPGAKRKGGAPGMGDNWLA